MDVRKVGLVHVIELLILFIPVDSDTHITVDISLSVYMEIPWGPLSYSVVYY